MRTVPIVPVGLQDQKLIKYLTDSTRCLTSVPDIRWYTSVTTWVTPFDLAIPLGDNVQRQGQPVEVRLARAVVYNSPQTPIDWGAGINWDWRGKDTVRIYYQQGLVENVKYQLTFMVVSGNG